MNKQNIEFFKSKNFNNTGSELEVGKIVRNVLSKIKYILNEKSKYSPELENMIKDILTRAYMLDKIFNPLKDNSDTIWDISGDDIKQTKSENIEKNPIYYHSPSIGIFFQGKPLLLNHNYIEALGAENEDELKKDIEEGKAIDKYYNDESKIKAKIAVSELQKGNQYKNLVLTTKEGSILSWNSFGNINGLEIRIGNDITHGTFRNTISQVNKDFKGIEISTRKLISNFINKINNIIDIGNNNKNIFIVFGILSDILDKVWNEGQYLINLTISDKEDFEMTFNDNYATALRRSKDEIEIKVKNKTLWSETYDEETLMLIDGLINSLKEDGYYISEFPIIDKDGKSRTYSWLRFLIEDSEFGLNRTFGIGTNAVSKDLAELRKLLD